MIVSITGPSGVGKTTLMRGLLRALQGSHTLESVTTRERRPTDEPGEYRYVSQEEFDAMSARGDFLWEVRPHGRSYATAKQAVDAALASEDIFIPPLVTSAVAHLLAHATSLGKETRVFPLYIWIEDEAELRKRFVARSDMTADEIESRLIECRSWNAEAKNSGVPFIYLLATKKREEILADAMARIQVSKINQ